MKSTYLVRVVSALVLMSAALTAQTARGRVEVPVQNWATPLYWQPNQAERQAAATASPNLVFPPVPGVISTDALIFVAMTPCRLVDTRDSTDFPPGFGFPAGIGNPSGPITNSGRTFPVQNFTSVKGNLACSTPLPSIAQAYSLNLTVVAGAGSTGYITAYPTVAYPVSPPSASPNTPPLEATLTWSAPIVTNSAIVPAGLGGSVTVVSGGSNNGTDLVIDINGYFAAPTDLNNNTALGFQSLQSATPGTTGTDNTAVGTMALASNTSGSYNTAVGESADGNNIAGGFGAFYGYRAGYHNGGDSNSFIGYQAGFYNTGSGSASGTSNSFFGRSTGFNSTTGSYNTFLGSEVGYNNNGGSYNTYVGYSAGLNSTGSSNLYLANLGAASLTESNAIRLGSKGTGAGQHSSVFVDTILLHPWASLDSLVSINNTTGQLGYLLFPNDSTKVLLGNGTFGTGGGPQGPPGPQGPQGIPGPGVSANCPPTINYVTKWLSTTSVGCSQITDTGTNVLVENPAQTFPAQTFTASLTNKLAAKMEIKDLQTNTPGSNALRLTNIGIANGGFAEAGLLFSPGISGYPYDAARIYAKFNSQSSPHGGRLTLQSVAGGIADNPMVDTLTAFNGAVGIATIQPNSTYTQSNVTVKLDVNGYERLNLPNGAGTIPICGLQNGTSDNGQTAYVLMNCASSGRFKEDIVDMGENSSKLLELRPVNFYYKPENDDGKHQLQYGLIAEEVAKLYPELVAYDQDGQALTVKYQELAPMLLNELQKQNAQIQNQAQTIQAQQEENRKLEDRLAALEALLSVKLPAAGAQR